jgi:hypothetical protein
MADGPGPDTLKALAAALQGRAPSTEIEALMAHAQTWAAEREACAGLSAQFDLQQTAYARQAEQLAALQERVDVLERDRKWWQDNAIRRSKRIAARRSGRPSRKDRV